MTISQSSSSLRQVAIACVLAGMLLTALAFARPGAAQTAQDSLERRPLKILMVTLGQDMNRINDGLWHGDFRMIKHAAVAIADHPRISPEQMAAIKDALDTRFQQFVAFDRMVHGTAVKLAESAENESFDEVFDQYSQLQRGCVSCHSAFREQLREVLY